jgi:dephospho-CoA kinase
VKLLGITGGIAMGKSVAARFLRQSGLDVADTDQIAHQLTEPGQPALLEIATRFGSSFLSPDGRLNRPELARLVFSDPAARAALQAILHPRIRALWLAQAQSWRAAGRACGVVVIPLLFETGAEKELDAVVCLACSQASQWQRLRQRGWSDDHIRQRIAAQWPVETKMARSDFVVWTDAPLDVSGAQLERVLMRLTSSAASAAPV